MMTNYKQKKGFTLLEVLIALVIFSIGLLGLAGLQSAGLRSNQISHARTVATQLAYDMADRIRNNQAQDNPIDYSAVGPSAAPNCITDVGGCTPAEMAGFDRDEWNNALADPGSPLKNAVGFIALNNGIYTISVGWDEGLTGNAPANCTLPLADGVACVTIEVAR